MLLNAIIPSLIRLLSTVEAVPTQPREAEKIPNLLEESE
jgi:hypothetical protein